jgi:predicted amidophosphoribosyltransferase
MDERKTVELMITRFCRDHHSLGEEGLCPECRKLLTYTEARLEKCPLLPDKPICARCPIHCYAPQMREQIRTVMRYSGPRMLSSHPILTLQYLLRKVRG